MPDPRDETRENQPEPEHDGGHIPIEPSEKPSPKARITAPPVTHGMSEDEIEEIETESERPRRRAREPEPLEEDAFCRPSWFNWRVPLTIGVVSMVVAIVLAGVNATGDQTWYRMALKQALNVVLYTWVGVGAVVVVARLLEQPFGRLENAIARMALVVGVFALVWQGADTLVQAQEWSRAWRWPIAAALGGGAYFLLLMWTFSVNRSVAVMLAGIHFLAWLVLWVFGRLN